MTDDDIDKTIEIIMKEIRESPEYLGLSCSANPDSHEGPCDPENRSKLNKK